MQRVAPVIVGLALYPAWVIGYLVGSVYTACRAIVNAFRKGFREADWP